tara:strand:- start:124618 stop:125577 length:960 start_codon:yes stop_codon:yes gene_type:complete
MTNLWLKIIRPKAFHAKWLILLLLVAIISLGAGGYFDVIQSYLDTEQLTFKVGDYKVSAYQALRSITILVLVFWLTAIFIEIAESRISKMKKIRAANRALILKIVQIFTYFIAALLALDIVGIDLTTLTVFSGAMGIGLGFGLQKIASNFISGLILMFERSIEIDDLIELSDGTFGFIRKASARFTLIETLDGKEILVPNEDLITSRVTNWTYSNKRGRIEIPIGVSYGTDIELAQKLILESAAAHPKSMKDPEPRVYLRNFGDSSVDFILHFWVADICEGRWLPQSEVMFTIWRVFKENKIEIPFPQRDVHIHNKSVD